jgi:MoxR-like ATPase
MSTLTGVRDRIRARVVGRERELDLVLAAVAAGRDILLEGPPGTSKSTLLRAITSEWGIPLVLVEGNADLTPAKLVGHHNPARVLREDYSPDNFVDGPLVEAMRGGGFLYIEEFNRAPEDTVNTLLTAMAERRIAVPRAGEVVAASTFRVIASMNPYDNIGTSRLSTSVHDRLCRLAVTYQDAAAERGIVALRAPQFDQALAGLKPARYERLVADAVAVTRATRAHEDIRQGSSVRGAIDLTLVAGQLFELATERANSFHSAVRPEGLSGQEHEDEKSLVRVSPGTAHDPDGRPARDRDERDGAITAEWDEAAEQAYRDVIYDAMVVALSGRIFLDETVDATPEQVLRQVWEDHFILGPAAAAPG